MTTYDIVCIETGEFLTNILHKKGETLTSTVSFLVCRIGLPEPPTEQKKFTAFLPHLIFSQLVDRSLSWFLLLPFGHKDTTYFPTAKIFSDF